MATPSDGSGRADPELERLTQLVNDERARRAYAEKELAEQRRQTADWRKRARSAEAAARFSIRLPRRTPTPVPPVEPRRHRIAFPSIRAGVAGVPAWVSQAFDTVDLDAADEATLTGLDVVIVGGGEVPAALEEWLQWPTRPPMAVFAPSGPLADLLRRHHTELVVGDQTVPAAARLDALDPKDLSEPSRQAEARDVAERISGARGRTVRDTGAALLRQVGIEPPQEGLAVTAVAMTKRPHRVRPVLETLQAMDIDGLRVFLATHGFAAESDARDLAEGHFGDRLRFFEMPDEAPLGRCLNELVDQTTTEAWAKIDDDDFYGPLYFEEALLELERTGADMVGKLTHYLYDSSLDKTFLLQTGNEYRHTRYVLGPTFVGRRHTWEEVRFPHRHARVDSIFIRGMNVLGMSIYSTSRFEFSYGRGEESHTWHVDESFYEAKGRLVGEGFAADEIFLPEAH